MGETASVAYVFHGVNIVISLSILGFVFSQHTIYVRMKDRINSLWKQFCEEKDIQYIPVDNGKK